MKRVGRLLISGHLTPWLLFAVCMIPSFLRVTTVYRMAP